MSLNVLLYIKYCFRRIRIKFSDKLFQIVFSVFLKLIQILLPLYGKKVFFLAITLFAAWDAIAFICFAATDDRDNMVKSQFFWVKFTFAVVALTFATLILPPLRFAHLAGFLFFFFDVFFVCWRKEVTEVHVACLFVLEVFHSYCIA